MSEERPQQRAPGNQSAQELPGSRARRARTTRSLGERSILVLGVVGTVIALLSAGALAWGLDKWAAIDTVDFGSNVGEAGRGQAANWLLVGSDSREGIDANAPNAGVILGEGAPEGKRTDTILVARVDPGGGVIHLLSIPRDLLVTYSDGGDGRINAAFNGEDGAKRLLETVEQTFDIDINHYAEINFAGFQDVVDAVEGVPIWFDRPMRDAGSGLDISTAGCHTLTGSQALAFARGRNLEYFEDGSWHIDGSGDLGRNSRQQYFVRRLASTTVKHLDITDLGTINRVLDAGGQNLSRDQTVGPDDLIHLARTFASLSDDQVIGHSLPVFDFRASNGAAVLGLDTEAAQPVLAVFRGESASTEAVPVAPSAVYEVRNGSGTPGQAGEVAKELNQLGFDVPDIANNPLPLDRTVIRYPAGQEAAVERLASYLVAGPAYEVDPELTTVILVTGKDFEGLRSTPRDGVEVPAAVTPAPTPSTTVPVAEEAVAPVTQSTIGIVPGPTPAGTDCD